MAREEIARIPVRIVVNGLGEAEGEFIRFLAPRTVDALLRILPLRGRVAEWRDQVYFLVPLKMGAEKAVSKVEEGEIAYWPMGAAVCVFRSAMRPHGPVSRVGRILSGLEVFRDVPSGTPIRVERKAPSS